MKEIIFLVEEAPEGGWEARALGHSIYTQAETSEELKTMIQDAVKCHFEENKAPLPDPQTHPFSRKKLEN